MEEPIEMRDAQEANPETSDDASGDLEAILAENAAMVEQFLAGGDTDAPLVSEALTEGHRSGVVAVMGKPNVGKSSLMNALLGEKLAIVTPKPQTTRETQLGILTWPDMQTVFVDTPGIHEARNKLGEYMVGTAESTVPDADLILLIVDLATLPESADEIIARHLAQYSETPQILALNKLDLVDDKQADEHAAAYQALVPEADPVRISATERDNLDRLLEMIAAALPEGPRYYPADQITDQHIRAAAAELIREQALLMYEQEVPHAVAVSISEFKERSADMTYIAATIFVERESQKGILIGKRGSALKSLGRQARSELEALLGTQVYLDLWVKVLKNWRKDENALKRLGYAE